MCFSGSSVTDTWTRFWQFSESTDLWVLNCHLPGWGRFRPAGLPKGKSYGIFMLISLNPCKILDPRETDERRFMAWGWLRGKLLLFLNQGVQKFRIHLLKSRIRAEGAIAFLQEFGLGDHRRQLALMISELLNSWKRMVPLRLGRQSSYVTVGCPRLKASFQRALTPGLEGEWRGGASQLPWERHGAGEQAESQSGWSAASATNLPRHPAKVTRCLGSRFLAHWEQQTVQQSGSAGGLPRRARPQRPRWLAACPRTTHLLWSHFPQLRNRHRGSTPPAGCLESHVRKRTQRALGAGLLTSSREMSCRCCYGGYCYCCSLPNNRRNTRPRSRLPAVKHRLLAGSTHNGLGELN